MFRSLLKLLDQVYSRCNLPTYIRFLNLNKKLCSANPCPIFWWGYSSCRVFRLTLYQEQYALIIYVICLPIYMITNHLPNHQRLPIYASSHSLILVCFFRCNNFSLSVCFSRLDTFAIRRSNRLDWKTILSKTQISQMFRTIFL